ncbi:MAG: hypothetical protein HY938_12005 [Nitrosomonadales bacterium]|nr:hypothetical protein [Nitrosomonadales bacterium]
MRQKPDVSPYMFSTDMSVNVSLTLNKIRKRIRMANPAYKPTSRYQGRLKHKRAARRIKPGIVR